MPALTNEAVALVSVKQLVTYFQLLQSAIASWNATHQALLVAVEQSRAKGWLLGAGGLTVPASSTEGLRLIKSEMCSLEAADDSTRFRLIGAIHLPVDRAHLVIEAHGSRVRLDKASTPLRKMLVRDLERLPEATDIPGVAWGGLMPSSSVWRAVAAAAGVPRIQIRFAVRPLHIHCVAGERPRSATFSLTKQCISSRRDMVQVRAAVTAIYEDNDLRAEAARRDLRRLDALEQVGGTRIAYRYFGGSVAHLNLVWGSGAKKRLTSSLPLFLSGTDIEVAAPHSHEGAEREERSDKQYDDRPILETVPIFTTREISQRCSSIFP